MGAMATELSTKFTKIGRGHVPVQLDGPPHNSCSFLFAILDRWQWRGWWWWGGCYNFYCGEVDVTQD